MSIDRAARTLYAQYRTARRAERGLPCATSKSNAMWEKRQRRRYLERGGAQVTRLYGALAVAYALYDTLQLYATLVRGKGPRARGPFRSQHAGAGSRLCGWKERS